MKCVKQSRVRWGSPVSSAAFDGKDLWNEGVKKWDPFHLTLPSSLRTAFKWTWTRTESSVINGFYFQFLITCSVAVLCDWLISRCVGILTHRAQVNYIVFVSNRTYSKIQKELRNSLHDRPWRQNSKNIYVQYPASEDVFVSIGPYGLKSSTNWLYIYTHTENQPDPPGRLASINYCLMLVLLANLQF